VDGTPRLPAPRDGRRGPRLVALQHPDMDQDGRARARARRAEGGHRRRVSVRLRCLPLRRQAPRQLRPTRSLHRPRARPAPRREARVRPRSGHRRERYVRLRERSALRVEGRTRARALFRPRRLLGPPLAVSTRKGGGFYGYPASTRPSVPARISPSRGESRRPRATSRTTSPRCSTPRRVGASPPRRLRSTWATTMSASTASARTATPGRSSRSGKRPPSGREGGTVQLRAWRVAVRWLRHSA
jgi:hypothetical protein